MSGFASGVLLASGVMFLAGVFVAAWIVSGGR